MIEVARLVFPAIRWDADGGFRKQRPGVERALELGCGGFIIFGGEVSAVRDLCAEVRERSASPLLIASDLERGAGQQFAGATGLPPLAALGRRGVGSAHRAAKLTAREALSVGVNWVLAPVCDLDIEPANPIVGTRAFGSEPALVAELVSEWIEGCQGTGCLACAKHFPGHGRTRVDSHADLPVVEESRTALWESDLVPFRSAIESGVGSILTAHVAYPALDPTGTPATLSRRIVTELLRGELGFDGIVVTDAMIMEGVLRGTSESEACVAALAAGCDVVLYPVDIPAAVKGIAAAVQSGRLNPEEVRNSLRRLERWSGWAQSSVGQELTVDSWGGAIARSCVMWSRGDAFALSRQVDLLLVDDDVGGPYPPPSRTPLVDALRSHGVNTRVVQAPTRDGRRSLVVALFGDVRSWKGRAGYSAASVNAVLRAVREDPGALVVHFSHPRLAEQLPPDVKSLVCAWGGEEVMQRAAAAFLAEISGWDRAPEG